MTITLSTVFSVKVLGRLLAAQGEKERERSTWLTEDADICGDDGRSDNR